MKTRIMSNISPSLENMLLISNLYSLNSLYSRTKLFISFEKISFLKMIELNLNQINFFGIDVNAIKKLLEDKQRKRKSPEIDRTLN